MLTFRSRLPVEITCVGTFLFTFFFSRLLASPSLDFKSVGVYHSHLKLVTAGTYTSVNQLNAALLAVADLMFTILSIPDAAFAPTAADDWPKRCIPICCTRRQAGVWLHTRQAAVVKGRVTSGRTATGRRIPSSTHGPNVGGSSYAEAVVRTAVDRNEGILRWA